MEIPGSTAGPTRLATNLSQNKLVGAVGVVVLKKGLNSLSKRLLGRLLLAVMLSSLLTACATGSDVETADPQDCARQGGTIQTVCPSQESLCVIPYHDAGLPCRDSDDCAGACLAHTAVNQDEPAVGECERTNAPCGCRTYIEDGRVADAICVD